MNEQETGVAAREGGDLPALAMWPAGTPYPPAVTVAASCVACGVGWRIHRDLCGFRLRCRCGAWVDVPRLVVAPPTVAPPTVAPRKAIAPREEIAPRPAATPAATHPPRAVDAEAELAAIHLRPFEESRRLRGRTILECVLLTAAFLVPSLVLRLAVAPHDVPRWMPVASTAASLLVLLVYRGARRDVAVGWTEPRLRYWFEASAVMVGAVLLALVYESLLRSSFPQLGGDWIAAVREQTGLGLAFFTIAFCPGLFEELAFRGLIQVRMTRLLGATQGLLVTAALFAIAHGPQLGLPLQAGLGLYLCSLRARSGSIMPCVLVHLGYNGALVVLH
jgi:membrane protease YdiL (CAAX protease family)